MLNFAIALIAVALAHSTPISQDVTKAAVAAAPQPTELFAADLFGGEMDGTFGCRFQCVREAFAAYRECIDGGGTREECRMVFQTTYESCLAGCDPSCEELCFAEAQEVYRTCIKSGEPRRQCGRMAFEFLMDCLESCDP